MNILEILGGVFLILASIAIVIAVTLQESPKGDGLSALSGGDSYYNKNQGRTLDAILSKSTKILAVVFFIISIAVYAIQIFSE